MGLWTLDPFLQMKDFHLQVVDTIFVMNKLIWLEFSATDGLTNQTIN